MTGDGGARGLSFPAGRGGGSIMKASGTVSEGRDERGRGWDRSETASDTESEGAVGRAAARACDARERPLRAQEALPGP